MKIFPEIDDINLKEEDTSRIRRSFLFDKHFIIVDGTPKETTEKEALQCWFKLLLNTPVDQIPIYAGTAFGVNVKEILGKRALPKGYGESEIERRIKEAAELNPALVDCVNFRFLRSKKGMEIQFDAILKNKDIVGVGIAYGL